MAPMTIIRGASLYLQPLPNHLSIQWTFQSLQQNHWTRQHDAFSHVIVVFLVCLACKIDTHRTIKSDIVG